MSTSINQNQQLSHYGHQYLIRDRYKSDRAGFKAIRRRSKVQVLDAAFPLFSDVTVLCVVNDV